MAIKDKFEKWNVVITILLAVGMFVLAFFTALNAIGYLPFKASPNIQVEYSIKYLNETALYRIDLDNTGNAEATNLIIRVSFPKNVIIEYFSKSGEPINITGGAKYSYANITYLMFLDGQKPIKIIFTVNNTLYEKGEHWSIDDKPFIWTKENKQINDVKFVDYVDN